MLAHTTLRGKNSTLLRTSHRESLGLIIAVLGGLIVVLFAASQVFLGGSFVLLEEQAVRKDVQRVFDALQSDLDALNSKAGDWGNWDDAYAFVQEPNPEFIKSNLTDDAFRQLQINLILFLQPSGHIVDGKAFDLERQVETALPSGLDAYLAEPHARDVLLRIRSPESTLTGILPLPERLMLISSRPIMTSEGKGPPRGTLIFGRYLDAAEIKRLAETTHLSLTPLVVDSPEIPGGFRLDQTSILVQTSGENEIAGYRVLKDIYAAPALVLRVDEAREVYQQGQTALHYFLVWIVGICLVSGTVLYSVSGKLHLSRQALHESDERYQVVVEQAADGIFLVDPKSKQVLDANAAFRVLLGYNSEEISGLTLYDLLACDRKTIERDLQRLLGGKYHAVGERPYYRKDGSLIETESSASLVKYNGHQVICVVARDITARKTEQARNDRRHRELEAERTVATAMSRTLELHPLLDLALDQVLAALQVDAGSIYLADDAQTELTLAVFRHPSSEYATRWERHRFGEGITGRAALQRETVLIPNLDEDPRVSQDRRESPRLLSQVSVPLIVENRVVGVLNVNGYEPQHFSEDDAALLHAIGASVAIAIDRARLFETLEQRVGERTGELAALNRIAAAVNQSLDLDEILATALEELVGALQVRGGWIHLLDPEKNELRLRAERGETGAIRERGMIIRAGEGVIGRMIQDRQPLAMNLEQSAPINRDNLAEARYQSMCAVPLIVDERVVGVLGMASDRRDRFGDAELRWLTAVGNTIAVTLKNALLFESVEGRLKQLATLRAIDRTLSSMLDLKPTLETTLSRLEEIVPFDSAAVLLLDGTILHTVAARGREQTSLNQFALDISNNAVFKEMEARGMTCVFDDLSNHPEWVGTPGLEFARAWLGAPLFARGELIGQLSLFSGSTRAFTREHAELVLSFADHAAIAIANARLHAALHEQARCDSLTQVLNHGAFITDLHAAVERNETLALIMFDLDNFKLYNDTYGHVVGDTVLKTTVQAIRAHIKNKDFVGRWGGEEFAIALRDADTGDATQVAARIRETLARTPVADQHGRSIPPPTASQGIAALPEAAHCVDELIEQADRALYRAKARGRDQVATAEQARFILPQPIAQLANE